MKHSEVCSVHAELHRDLVPHPRSGHRKSSREPDAPRRHDSHKAATIAEGKRNKIVNSESKQGFVSEER